MVASRKLKPEFFTDADIAECPISTRLFFLGLIVFSTKWGKVNMTFKQLHAAISPKETASDVRGHFEQLTLRGFISTDPALRIIDISKWCQIKPDATEHAQEAKRRARKIQALPGWADLQAIKSIYKEAKARCKAGEKVHVDHIVPLAGKSVSGLHVHFNLRIISAAENIKKSNRFEDAE